MSGVGGGVLESVGNCTSGASFGGCCVLVWMMRLKTLVEEMGKEKKNRIKIYPNRWLIKTPLLPLW